jgi:hypothetical protein
MAARDPDGARGPQVLTWLVAAGTLLGTSMLVFRRKTAPGAYGEETGRGLPSTPPSRRALSLGFETHDMNPKVMLLVLGVLLASAGIGVALMFGLLTIFHSNREANAPRLTAEQQAHVEPPSPRLQTHPFQDLYARQSYEEGLLNAYLWLDPGHTRARIPIDRAMSLAVGGSLDADPSAAPQNAPQNAPGHAPERALSGQPAQPGTNPRTMNEPK